MAQRLSVAFEPPPTRAHEAGTSPILDGVGHGFWVRKLRVVELRIFDGITRFERSVERVLRLGWRKEVG